MDRGENAIVVRERLSHAHKYDVGQTTALSCHSSSGLTNLVDNLRGGKITLQTALTRRTEWACHTATGL